MMKALEARVYTQNCKKLIEDKQWEDIAFLIEAAARIGCFHINYLYAIPQSIKTRLENYGYTVEVSGQDNDYYKISWGETE